MSSASLEGLKSPAIQSALGAALAGRPSALETWLCRYGAGAEQRPNFRLAAALGVELAAVGPAVARSGAVGRLLARLGANDAAPDTPEVFLPIAAAFGWAAWISAGRDREAAWAALGELAADERGPVRLGVREALRGLAARPGGADELVRAASDWLERDERELRYGAAGVAGEVLGDRQVVTAIDDVAAFLSYVSRLIDEAAGAPRAAERSEGRRRLLMALPAVCAAIAAHLRAGDRGPAWLEAACVEARHPDVRAALSDAILTLRKLATARGPEVVQRLRQALEGSAKPDRDPTRRRPGTGRGRDSRRMK
ncbi:MAG TPA: hypothetical protein VFH68_22100 [Polyangia bacterium]|nr:hypothetical protein [Polyangia bacterium]